MAPQSAKAFREIHGQQASTVTTSDSVLIIIDAQNFYETGPLEVFNLQPSRLNILDLLNKYRVAGGDVIHVVHHTGDPSTIVAGEKNPEDEFEELTPLEGENVVIKNRISSFAQTNLHEILEKIGKKKIVLVGYMAHVCVSTTARAGNDLGYDVLVVSDAVGDRDIPGVSAEKLVPVVLAELGDAFATIIKTEDVL